MNRDEHLLTIAVEECSEIAQRLSKVLRFGLDEIQPGQPLNNRARVMAEYYDLRAVLGMIGFDAWENTPQSRAAENDKCLKVQKYLEYSREQGTLK